jgi:biotin-dependent carboxylase-like uncharacterized protein
MGRDEALEVVAGGLLTTVQDVVGRLAFGSLGVRAGGAMDVPAARLANRLVGNPESMAVLEVTGQGPTIRLRGRPRVLAVAGADLSATLDDRPISAGRGVLWRPGEVLSFADPRAGLRAYVALGGGVDVPPVLGSRATDLQFALGGFQGRALRAGDRLPLGPAGPALPGRTVRSPWAPPDPRAPVHLLPGPHVDAFTGDVLADLCAEPWVIGPQADRMGYRLHGGRPLVHRAAADITSIGLPIGAIQVPADGVPIVLLADHQPTGGYTVPATVAQADLPRLAQRGPGTEVRFVRTTVAQARAWLDAQRRGPDLDEDEGELLARWA